MAFGETEPGLLSEWDYERNGPLAPETLGRSSTTRVWWRCEAGHSWQTSVRTRIRGSNCPTCYHLARPGATVSFAASHPHLAREWDAERNGSLTAYDVTYGSRKLVAWRCSTNPEHRWTARVFGRSRGAGCPYCVNQKVSPEGSLAWTRPDLARQWDFSANGSVGPLDVSPGSQRKVGWICDRGHRWTATPKNRSSGRGCPTCAHEVVSPRRSLATRRPDLAAQWENASNGALSPSDVAASSLVRVIWRCGEGHTWVATVASRARGRGCPTCARQARRSAATRPA
jgi:hypothetical protein